MSKLDSYSSRSHFFKTALMPPKKRYFHIILAIGVKPLIHQSELRTYNVYMKVVPFQEKSSFHFGVL